MRFSSIIFLLSIAILSFGFLQAQDNISIDVIDSLPYIDYTISFDSNFSINLPDFSELIYAKALPNDINFVIKDSKLNVFSNKKGTIVLKYQGTKFLQGVKSYEKTLAFDLINNTKIKLTSDTNIINLKPDANLNEDNYYSWETNSKDFVLYIVLYKNPFSWNVIAIIIVCILIVVYLLFLKKIKAFFTATKEKIKTKANNKNDKENLFLDNKQKSILDLVKKSKAITQQEIADTLNIKKSHMSKILNKMERNNLIERKKVGKVNKIILAEK
jgi:uncharacterized membrane protein